MGIFGWSYPPGAANDPSAPYNQDDPPCSICGREVDDCVCPECPHCGTIGDPSCYVDDERSENHGLTLSDAQVASAQERRAADAAIDADYAAQAAAEYEYWKIHRQDDQ
jgi:hypothetical protein